MSQNSSKLFVFKLNSYFRLGVKSWLDPGSNNHDDKVFLLIDSFD